jgi:hypothetical protein
MKQQHQEVNTAEEAIDSKWVIGSPTYLTVFLKKRSWLKTFSAYKDNIRGGKS